MSAPDKPDLARGWLRAEKHLEEEAKRLATMSDDDFEMEMSALPEPAHVPTAAELLARGEERARERQAPQKHAGGGVVRSLPRSRWVALLVAAALGVVLVVIVAVTKRGEVVAWFKGDNTVEIETAPAPRRADDLRRQGLDACADRLWTICEGKLDEAMRLDPAGETDGRVKAARQSIDDARHPAPVLPRTPDQK